MNKLMKTIFIGIVVILLTFLIAYLDGYIHPKSYISHEETTISLKTMICNMCVSNIEKTFQETEGVNSAEVSLELKQAFVIYNSKLTDIGKIEESITSAGYDANDKAANPKAFEMLSECCKDPKNALEKHDSNDKSGEKNHKSCSHGCCNN